MSDLEIRKEAIRLAAASGGSPETVVARAQAFYEFLKASARPGKPKERPVEEVPFTTQPVTRAIR